MASIVIKTELIGDVCVLRPCGYVDEKGGAKLVQAAEEMLGKEIQKILIDFSEAPVINSTGISQIIELAEIIVDEKGGDLAYCGLSELAASVFKMVGLLQMGESYKDEKEALENLAN